MLNEALETGVGREDQRAVADPRPPRPAVAALLATCDRPALLRERSLPSVAAQSSPVAVVVIVNDGAPFAEDDVHELATILDSARCVVVPNCRVAGAAGAWNTGIDHLAACGFEGFVAILDDDDAWDAEHVAVNLEAAATRGANLVVSGLRMVADGQDASRPLVGRLHDRDFLLGNPGWQGSNTFVSLALLRAVGGFRDGLVSLNDRDLAIRLLRHSEARPALTGRWTASWHRDTPGNLSEWGSASKRAGLRAFWSLYGPELSLAESQAFFARAATLFGVPRASIVENDATQGRG